ncbi:hypothetical protein M5X11_15945 [Paenibacillus alginolyticus]|uniref:hypothetical protein n=1 Tax=Paenibacillus alginolyticus TaxID=59839 RepID=UPI00055FDFAA|nr:hypothetical protein [Paenibacillus alginolyticus]MCY9666436.1 hypothetical protein [Paenibacillus alginolyticus]
MVQFVMSITHQLYYRTRDKIYRVYEGMPWFEISQEELMDEMRRFKQTDEKYMVIYDYQIMNKLDYWDAHPEKITKDELDFWRLYGLINEEQYLHFINQNAS